ncbi:MAG: T9SS type A sorting domain-containing protein [Saprospiraceae bacterium]|nr:T9SS type A sorting domain-containing protein [Saprospiraceae bacterium]
MKKISITLYALIYILFQAKSQDINYLKDIGSLYDGQNHEVTIIGAEMNMDEEGNIYFMGRFADLPPFTNNKHPLFQTEEIANNYFLIKVDNDGELIWQKNLFSEDLFAILSNNFSVSYIHIRTKIFFNNDAIYLTGSYKNQIRVDSFQSNLDTTFSNNSFIIKLSNAGETEWIITGEDFSDGSSEFGVYDIVFTPNGTMIASLKLTDSLLISNTLIKGLQHPKNSSTESAIVEININSGEIENYIVLASTTGSGYVRANELYINDSNQLVIIGSTTSGLVVNKKSYNSSQNNSNMFIAILSPDLDEELIEVSFGSVSAGNILYLNEFEVIKDNQIAFSGFFRGSSLSLFNATLEGVVGTFTNFFGIIDLENQTCRLFPFGILSSSYSSNIELTSNENQLIVAGSIKEGEAILMDSLVNIDKNENGKIMIANINLSNFSYSLTNLSSIGNFDVIGLNFYQDEIFLASNYNRNYSFNDLEVSAIIEDVWFCKLTSLSTSSKDESPFNILIYPNPTLGLLHIDNIKYDKLKITDLFGNEIISTNYMDEIQLHSVADGLYILSLFIDNQIVAVRRIVKASNN